MMDHVNSPFKADRFFNFPQSSERPDEVDDLAVINSILSDFDAPPSATVLQADAAIATSTHQPADRAFGSFESGGLEFVGDSGTRDPFGGQYLTQDSYLSRQQDISSENDTPSGLARAHGHMDDSYREKNRAAQKKFRERQKVRKAQSHQRLQDLERSLDRLMREKKELEARNHMLHHTIMVNDTHYRELETQQESYQIQQELILMDTARIYRRGLNRPDLTIEDTKQFTMESFLSVFEHFMGSYKVLLENGGDVTGTASNKELCYLVSSRRLEEARIALHSKWSSAVVAWNREETASGCPQPSSHFYAQLLVKLKLDSVQQKEWLRARRQLLEQMVSIRLKRDRLALSLGLLMLQNKQDEGRSQEELQLRSSLEEEREAVLSFLYTVIDLNMTHVQEALLDVSCHPCLVKGIPMVSRAMRLEFRALRGRDSSEREVRQKREPSDTLAGNPEQTKFFPAFSATELLKEPLLARMGGLQLKRTVMSVPMPLDVLSAAKQPVPKIADMKDMKIFEVMCGKHLQGMGQPLLQGGQSSLGNGVL